MSKTRSKSRNWKRRQARDPFVRKATRKGYRSRATFKLEEVDQRDRLLRPGMKVVELGAAPGGWSQYVVSRIGPTGRLVAVDLLEMAPVDGASIIRGDFTDGEVTGEIAAQLPGGLADLVISDMAPNISGIRDADEARFSELLESIIEFCDRCLRPGGSLLVKLFQGPAADEFRRELGQRFGKGQVRKPGASRGESREYYYLARDKRSPDNA